MGKINTAIFENGEFLQTIHGLDQWDYGQILRIEGLELPTAVEIHFSLQETGGEAEIRMGVTENGITEVEIPEFILKKESRMNYKAYAFVYPSDEESGETAHKIIMNVRARPKPAQPSEDSTKAIIAAVNKLADQKITAPQTAEVGQMLVVEEVDEEGKPVSWKVADVVEGNPDAVLYTEQELTEEQQEQARANIGAASKTEVSKLSKEIVDQQTEIDNLRNEIPSVPVQSVNGKTGAVVLSASDVGATTKDYVDYKVADLTAQGIQQTPLFVDSIEGCTDTSKIYVLPDGYIYAYILTEKEISTGGYTNLLPTAKDIDGSIYNGKGYKDNTRLNSSGEVKDASGVDMDTSGKISCKAGDRLRIKSVKDSMNYTSYIYSYNDSNVKQGGYTISAATASPTTSDIDMTLDASTFGANFTNIRFCCGDINADTIVTINQEIVEGSTTIVKEYAWANTGRAFVPTDYEDRIVELENEVTTLKREKVSEIGVSEVFAPSPQLPADGSETADFNAETITCKNVYDYIDALVSKYPNYITKETLGKDESETYDWNRYTLCRRYYEAWQRQNYPKMYGWVNGSTTIYSKSVSPRIGDTLYTTPYIGTSKGTVSAVSNANQTRTVGNVVYTRDKTKDIEPTLVYTRVLSCAVGNSLYNASNLAFTTISSVTETTLVGANGITYTRYPLGDRNSKFVRPEVIVIGSNEHGRPLDPAEPTIISARMIKDLCECANANNPFFNMLKNEYMMVFCPIINPWGFDEANKSYYNSNGINLDRNMDTKGWGNDTTSGPQGSYGGSENETQYFMNTLVESGTKIVMANHGLGTQTNSTGEGANSGKCHYMLGRNNSKYDGSLLKIAETMLANYNLAFSDYGEAPPETYAKTRSYIDSVGAEGGAVEMQAREGYVLDDTSQLHTARILEADYTLHLQFLYMLISNAK